VATASSTSSNRASLTKLKASGDNHYKGELSMPKKKKHKVRTRQRDHELQCDICGAPDNDKTRFSATVARLDSLDGREQFLAFAQGGTDTSPNLVVGAQRTPLTSMLTGRCSDEALL
jgi:hypothetical protein